MDTSYIVHDGGKYVKLEKLVSAISENQKLKQEYEHALAENKALRMKSDIDPLANVYRRSAAIDIINNILKNNTACCALIVLDLDNFKQINDTFGHSFGDNVISTSAAFMIEEVGENGIIGRFGGDEFLIFLPDTTPEEAMLCANNIIQKISHSQDYYENSLNLACSAGIAYHTGSIPYKDLFARADKALYSAKQNGKRHAELFAPDMINLDGVGISYVDNQEHNNVTDEIVADAIEIASKASTTDEAVEMLLAHVNKHFNTERIKILHVDIEQDMVTVIYDYHFNNDDQRIKNNVGYYLHTDLVNFREAMPNRTAFPMIDVESSIFSQKFQKELCDTDDTYHIFYVNRTSDNNYSFCSYESSMPSKYRSEEEFHAISEISSIIMVYADRVRRVSKRERALQEQLITDKLTGVYTMGHFYEQSGLIRKLAFENTSHCYLIEVNPLRLADFNQAFSYADGDKLLKELTACFTHSEFKNRGIIAHNYGRFYVLIRTDADIEAVKNYARHRLLSLIKEYSNNFPKFKLRVSLGVTEVVQNEVLLQKIDDAKLSSEIVE